MSGDLVVSFARPSRIPRHFSGAVPKGAGTTPQAGAWQRTFPVGPLVDFGGNFTPRDGHARQPGDRRRDRARRHGFVDRS